MKTYRLELHLGGQTLVEADRVEEDSRELSFYHGDSVFVRWARSLVKHYECLPVSLDDIRRALATECRSSGDDGEPGHSECASFAATSRDVPA
ncbi:hypothetical protein [Roseimicrobium sp. ORNL1]|uniref:hypothetical protein n=1 Tax=Roseimicrobium sp. ORNL1 TaxID=2711231 RepID=UPI0013E116BB|nr:hypothetical protein [Roseimicrobium sp. ORNL1]QIF01857.1 hypothetical protein G5S37_10065 [Roseimicrobium sp. ORNL1]